MIEICKREDCVGCGACLSACNKGAISMQPDSLGFLYPVIDQNKCVDCGLCARSCFNTHMPLICEPLATYIGHALDNEEQKTSTSGGAASVFMKAIIKAGGIVYGCSGLNAREVKHIRIDKIEDVCKLKGSKYVQSYMGKTYRSVVADLKSDRLVLFIGTPCQVAGLKAFVRGREYDNLYTLDFVCHGVPSQKILNDAIDEKIKEQGNFSLFNRVKENGKRSRYTLRLVKDNRILCDDVYPSCGYITGFLCGLYYRENCYNCKFARRERVSDITLGDFWDDYNDIKTLSNKKDGLSMIIVNTMHGQQLFDIDDSKFDFVSWNYEDFIRRNGQLDHPIRKNPKRGQFETVYLSTNFGNAIDETLHDTIKTIKKGILLNKLKKYLIRFPLLVGFCSQINKLYNIIRYKHKLFCRIHLFI